MRTICYVISALAALAVGLFLGQHSRGNSRAANAVLYYVDRMRAPHNPEPAGSLANCGGQFQPVRAEDIATANRSLAALGRSVVIDSRTRQAFGIQLATAQRAAVTGRLRVLGRVAADQSRIYRVNMAVDGFVKEVSDKGIGSYVKKEQHLAVVYSPEFLAIAAGYLSAQERTQRDAKETSQINQGVAGPQNWADRLRNLGMSDSQIAELNLIRRVPEVIYISSPVDGFIQARNISSGQKFDRYTEFYRIADLRHVWILADLFANESQYFRPGISVRVTAADQTRPIFATVADVLPQVNSSARTLQLRLVADNEDFALRPDMFVDLEIPRTVSRSLMIPVDALMHSSDMQNYVYVDHDSKSFERREVQTGLFSGNHIEVLKGLREGEQVVASGAFLVNAEARWHDAAQQDLSHVPGLNAEAPQCILPGDAAGALESGNAVSYHGAIYYFCSKTCRDRFQNDPVQYLSLLGGKK